MKQLFLLFALFPVLTGFSQNIGIGTVTPHPSSKLEISSNNSGFLPPRMTYSERNSIANPAQGLIIYCTDCGSNGGEPQYFNGNAWLNMIGGAAQPGPAVLPNITIGTQVWSQNNLDVATYRNGDPIPQVSDPTQWANLTTGAWCWYNNDSAANGSIYGRLYNWYAINDSRGLAPTGWHIATSSDWNKMTKYLDPTVDTSSLMYSGTWNGTNIGMQLKNTSGWQNNGNGTNSTGFTALPGGYRSPSGNYFSVGYAGYWLTSTQYDNSNAFGRGLDAYTTQTNISYYNKRIGMSVRLVKD